MTVPSWVWILTLVIVAVIFAFDLLVLGRRPHEPSRREVSIALSIYVALAVLFGLGVLVTNGGQLAGEFFAGWLTEYSLSVDNLFIFLIIMAKFGVPRKYQQYALMVGIVMALIMRAIFILVGAAAINQWSWVFYLFGAFLIYTAVKLAKENIGHADEEDEEFQENALLRAIEKRFPVTQSWDGGTKLRVVENGKRVLTPMFIVILALGTTDLLFALDSIPAIFGLTQEPYLVLMANVFALMGLRQLYFLLGDLLKRLVYLGLGLAVLLAFIGVKLILHALHENELPFINGGEHVPVWDIPIWFSLGAIVVILGVTAIASLAKTRGRARVPASVGGREEHDLHLDDVSLFGETQQRHEDRQRRPGGDSSAPGDPGPGGEQGDRPGEDR
ncbi:TerC family protein [Ornithinimicrobium pekingense]|uniref:Tellurium resistance protein TerC n=1 Tax=Ornithinimicrobium pekingense TaxID=384677 RepID=A0ABQ2FAH7_9MICO|nr:TerC family protein [Ornithinimicrobium pekingense]GGK74579.1 tellurium resistance protein TerC [Ornithinimicrobium pekingense]